MFKTRRVTVSLLRNNNDDHCSSQGALLTGPDHNTNTYLLNVLDFLTMPCGELAATDIVPGATVITSNRGVTPINALCVLRPGGDLHFFTNAPAVPALVVSIPTGRAATCAVTVTAVGCNGVPGTSTLNVVLLCP